jgi:hypothetical protein
MRMLSQRANRRPFVPSFGVFSQCIVAAASFVVSVHAQTSTNCVPPPFGLVSWWRAEGNGLDAQGINHGTIMGGGGFTNAMVGRGFVFSGSGDDYIALPPNMFPMPLSNEMGNAPFSFELWLKTTASGVVLGQQDQAPFNTALNGNVPAIYVGTNGLLYAQMFWGADNPLSSAGSVADGQFHHVAVTYDGVAEILYLDGVSIAAAAFSQQGYADSYFYQIGTGWSDGWPESPGGWFPFTGIVDEPSLYDRALSASEVAVIFHAGSAGKCAPPGGPALVHRYSFNEPADAQVARDSVSRSDGTLVFASTDAPYTNGTPDGSAFNGNGRLVLRGGNGFLSLPPRLISWLSNATFEAWVTWNGPSTSVWQRVWDFGYNDRGTNLAGIGTNYLIFCPSRGGTERMGFEETIVNPFGSDPDPNSLILFGPDKLAVGQQVYVAVTYDPLNSLSRLFINGSLVASTSKPLNAMNHFTDYNNYLGRSQWTRDPFFDGEYDEFRIWDGVLSAEDIASHYSAGPNEQFVRVRPYLFLNRAGPDVLLSWYTNFADGFQLQSATTPSASSPNWVNVTNAVTVTNASYQVRVPVGGGARFYRLRR